MTMIEIKNVDSYDWVELMACCQNEGFGMVSRLLADFEQGANRFDEPGEALFVHLRGNRVIAVAGLNRERDVSLGRAGRVRRLYVSPKDRGRGLGRKLISQIVLAAQPSFDLLTVNVGQTDARGFYEQMGFTQMAGKGVTHVMRLIPQNNPS